MNINEIIIKAYKYFVKQIGVKEHPIGNNKIINIEHFSNQGPSIITKCNYENNEYYWYSIINFDSIKIIYDYINNIINKNNLFECDYLAKIHLEESDNNKNKILYPINKEIRKVYTIVSNKILSIISRPFLDKPIDLKEKINLFINLESIFNKEGSKEKMLKKIEDLIIKNEYKIISLIHLLELRYYAKFIKNSIDKPKSSIFNIPIPTINNDFYKIIYDNPSNFILVITNIVLNSKRDIDVTELISNINDYFNYDLEEFNFDIYKLINEGKQKINHWLKVNKKLSEESINSFWEQNTLGTLITKNNFAQNLVKKYEQLLLIYIGYGLEKNYFELIDKKINEIIKDINENPNENYFKIRKISHNKWALLKKLIKNPYDMIVNKWLDNNFIIINYEEEINKEFEGKSFNWFNTIFEKYVIDKKITNNKLDLQYINLYWKIIIITLYENKEHLIDGWEDIFMFWFLTAIDTYLSSSITAKNIQAISEEEIKKIETQLYIKSSYNKEQARANIKNVYGKYVVNLDNINDIALVDNSMLSIVDKYKFTSYEFIGDIIYKIIMNDLRINCLIDYYDNLDIYSHITQEEICQSINFKDNIQKNDNVYYDEKEISDADYFEVFIYFLYKNNGYFKAKEIVLSLIEKNYQELLTNKNKIEWAKDENDFFYKEWLKNKKLTILEPIYCTSKRYDENDEKLKISFLDNNIYSINPVYFNEFCKIMKEIFKSWLKIFIFESKSEIWCNINFDNNKINISYSKILDDMVNNIAAKFENENKNVFYNNLYYLYKNNFNEFTNYIGDLINEKY